MTGKNKDLHKALVSYYNWATKLKKLRQANYTDQLALLYQWVYDREIDKGEFIYLLSHLLFSNK